jgi:hypothetical protein
MLFGKKKQKEQKEEPEWKPESPLGKLWYFIWYDDSAWSWMVNVLLAYILIKFIFYPLIGLVLGTSFPIVAVVSESMVHQNNFDNWWTEHEDEYLAFNITKSQFEDYPFKNGFNKGDLMILVGKDPENIRVGDVIVFQSRKPYPIIHRVIEKREMGLYVFQTKGDNNKFQIRDGELDETRVLEKTIHGNAVVRIPFVGYVKIWFVDFMKIFGINIAG